MNILVVTLHRVWNFGSVLQAYATQEILSNLKHKVTIADYIQPRFKRTSLYLSFPDKFKNSFLKKNLYRILMFPMRLRLDILFSRFMRKLSLTPKKHHDVSSMKELGQAYDIFVTGSDQVWNSLYNGGVDKALFLDFAPEEKKRTAYAASFGMDYIPTEQKNEIFALAKKYHAISVRESSAIDLLPERNDVVNVLDPTLVLNSDFWGQFASKRRVKEKYLLLYALHGCNDHILSLAKKIAALNGWKIVSMNYGFKSLSQYKFDKYLSPNSPEDFVSLIKNAEYVIADSFHGMAFSINFNREFLAVLPDRFECRLLDLIKVLDLEDRITSPDITIEKATKPIDWKSVNGRLEKEREISRRFIKEAIWNE